jgi:TfoX/Sxy family transcriptional regulator of competence genes
MAYDEELDGRVTEIVSALGGIRKKMFGGTCHLLNGNMVCGVLGNRLLLRLGEDRARDALENPGVAPADMSGRPMKGWVTVEGARTAGGALRDWIDRAHAFVRTLPPK